MLVSSPLTPTVTAQVRVARPLFSQMTNNRKQPKKNCGTNLSVKWGLGEVEERGQGPALLLFDLPEVVQCPPSMLFFTALFQAAYLSTPLFICYRGNKVRGKYEMLPFEFPILPTTLKTTSFDADVFAMSSKIRKQQTR